MAEIKVELVPFTVPNFVSGKLPPRPRQEGYTEELKWPLSEIDANALSDLCDEFRADVFQKAGKADPR